MFLERQMLVAIQGTVGIGSGQRRLLGRPRRRDTRPCGPLARIMRRDWRV